MLIHPLLLAAALMLAAAPAAASDHAAACADREKFPRADWPCLYYLTTAAVDAEARTPLAHATAYVTASTSRQSVIERCIPLQVSDTLWRIDLRDFLWDARTFHDFLVKEYPYGTFLDKDCDGRFEKYAPLVIRADWLTQQISDQAQSDIHLKLLYGAKVPKNRDEFLAFWRVDDDDEFRFGAIEEQSGVSVVGIRWLEARPLAIPDGFAWGTRDTREIDAKSDPLEHLLGDQVHQAEEWIVSLPKLSQKTQERGHLLACLLSDNQGKIQAKAPTDIVVDHTGVRGAEIRNPLSCYVCHERGINETTINGLVRYLKSGARVSDHDKQNAEKIERFHLGALDKTIRRNQEDFEAAVRMCNGLDGASNARGLKLVVQAYDADVTYAAASRELGADDKELSLAIAYGNAHGRKIAGRLADLAHGSSVKRTRWEDADMFYQAFLLLSEWRSQ